MVVHQGRFEGRFPALGAWLAGLAACVFTSAACANTNLTDTEQRWIAAAQPVLAYARNAGLPLDIIVQPVVRPEISPLSMAFINGRCKLVLTMRGNPMVERHLEGVPPALHDVVIEAMTAHELGHCWRHARGDWRAFPAGFARAANAGVQGGVHSGDVQAQQREEGFADLVGLAWTRMRHPAHYRQVHAWLTDERLDPGAAHDTAVWVSLARDPSAFGSGSTLFEQARVLWEAGLKAGAD
ncbi:MAG: hypothetical protein V4757_16900 [Pseudomonadota bacterium]